MQQPDWAIPADNLESADATMQKLTLARKEGRMLNQTAPTLERRPFSAQALAARAAKREMVMSVYLRLMRRLHGMTVHQACKLMLESGEVKECN